MPLPKSFAAYKSAASIVRNKRIIISIEGITDSGKTEFVISAPGPGIVLAIDRGLDGCIDNPEPPESRNLDNFAFHVISSKPAGSAKQDEYLEYWRTYKTALYSALDNPDARTVAVDGDSDTWELQRLAAFGKLTQVMPHHYTEVNAARRAMLSRMYESGKIVILTQKMKKEYIPELDAEGKPVKDSQGREQRVASGQLVSQGFSDTEYLVGIRLRALFKKNKAGKTIHGVEILKCKSQMDLVGQTLWQSDCNFKSLMGLVYPNVEPEEWGELA